MFETLTGLFITSKEVAMVKISLTEFEVRTLAEALKLYVKKKKYTEDDPVSIYLGELDAKLEDAEFERPDRDDVEKIEVV